MDNEILLALEKFKAGSKVRETVKAGQYDIDAIVRIVGTMKVGNDHPAKISAAVPWQRLVGVLFSKVNGVTMESVVREALAAGPDLEDEISERAQAAVNELVEAQTATRKGRVTLKVEVQGVDLS